MVWLAGSLDIVFLVVAFGVRTWLQWRRTRDSGWRLGRPHRASAGAARALMFTAGALLGASLAVGPWSSPWPTRAAGVVIALAAVALVAVAQVQMGASWRVGVDPNETTALVSHGLYARVRNPIYTGMVVFAVGQLLVVPSLLTVAAVLAMTAGVELQARAVEEPYLRTTHGPAFTAWATVAGRFVPGLGRWSEAGES
ncbi:MAG TPA: isoprenylcysteine carboxylmethyltransferase family protein [Acidimicrobiales bacterium]|jgi:protein-S-isoprenylcysteine O-methyltransferase Ste14|nr:isoprenylcysteine carboxylmethyltransferase family protein [Acidimicrobiales bacterium]